MSSHEAHATHHNEEPRSKSSMSASFWFVIILVGLFIAALNFINAMGGHEAAEGGHVNKEATSNQTMSGETGLGKPETQAQSETEKAGGDSTHAEEAHH